jgi:hypothetical protein
MSESKRYTGINYFKAILVVGMIFGHSLSILTKNPPGLFGAFVTYINLVSFSGFYFAYGYLFQKVYMQRDSINARFLKGTFKTLIAFYICAICYRIFVDPGVWPNSKQIVDILILNDIPLYSEFLLSFFALSLLFFIFFKPLKRFLDSNIVILVLAAVSLLSTFIPYQYINSNQIGLLIGTYNFHAFSVLQYLVFFLLGVFFAKNNIIYTKLGLLISIVGTGSFCIYFVLKHAYPTRFPVSLLWLIGSFLFLYVYFILSEYLSKKIGLIRPLDSIGENTLFYLVVSDAALFAMKKAGQIQALSSILIGFAIILSIYYLTSIIRKTR